MQASITRWLLRFLPDEAAPPLGERLISALAVAAGVLFVAVTSMLVIGSPGYLVAAVGASACILFCLPASPLAQPWAVIGGYLLSATIGLAVLPAGWPVPVAAALAVGLSVLAMMLLRCLHPPSGALALSVVLTGDRVAAAGFQFVLFPVALNAALLVLVALILNNALPNRHYPRRTGATHSHRGFSARHLHAALGEYGHVLAMSEEELDQIITLAEQRAKVASTTVKADRHRS